MLATKRRSFSIRSNEGDIDIFPECNIADRSAYMLSKHTEYNLIVRVASLLLYSQTDVVENTAILRYFDVI